MKINIIMPGLGDSGGIKVVRKYAQLWKKMGTDVIIYCPIKAYNLHRYESQIKNRIHQIYCTLKTIITIIKNEKKEVKWVWSVNNNSIRNADKVIATMWATAYDVNRLNITKGKKIYFVQDYEIWDNKELGENSYKLNIDKIVISTWINEQLRKNIGIGPFPIVMNGIDKSVFYDRLTRSNNQIVFLMLNHTLEKKGVKQGIMVFEKIRNIYPEAKLVMFGMCDNSNLPDYVEYYQNPSQDKLVELYCKSNYFLFPSLEEGWGLTPIEAMACGCVVLGSSTGFVLDLGKHKENMMICTVGNVDDMVNCAVELIEDKSLIEKIRRNAFIMASELNWDNSAKLFLKKIEEM